MAHHRLFQRSQTHPFLMACGFGALAVAIAAGCRSQNREDRKAEQNRLTMEMWRELIEKGTLSPVDSMEDAFEEFRPEMGATPEDYRLLDQPGAEGTGTEAEAEGESTVQTEPGTVPEPEPEVESEAVAEPEVFVVEPPPNYYAIFGPRIIVHGETGLISKPYPMRKGASTRMMDFITAYGDFPMWGGEGPHTPDHVHLSVLADMDTEFLSNSMRGEGPAPAKDVPMGDWLMVTASPEMLEEIEAFIDTFAGGPPQIEIEAKIVEWVVRDSLDLGISNVSVDFPDQTLIDTLGWTFPNGGSPDTGGEFFAGISSIHDGVTYAAMFEALASYENVSIISRPKVAVRDGTKAKIEAITKLPYLKVTGINNSGNATTQLAYENVGVSLYVTPRLVGTGTIALQIDIEASQQTGNAVTLDILSGSASQAVSTPILSTRTAETVVYLKPQQAVILGGLISERTSEEETGIPLLKELPLLGYLFKSTFETTEKTTLLFFIRPRLIGGTDLNQPF